MLLAAHYNYELGFNIYIEDETQKMSTELKAGCISEAIGTILAKFCYPAADELGAQLGESVGKWRRNNVEQVLSNADKKYNQLSVSKQEYAHPRLAHEIIEQGSWTDDIRVQEMWAGLLVSACTVNGEDESNIIFTNILSKLTTLGATLLNYICENCEKSLAKSGTLSAERFTVEVDELMKITGVQDLQRIDLELDHLRALELIWEGIEADSGMAHITPTGIALNMYVRCKGHKESPVTFFGLTNP